jgi:hypothetical protein
VTHLALGAALYYNTDLTQGAAPLRTLWNSLTRKTDVPLVQWVSSRNKGGKKSSFDLARLEAHVQTDATDTAAIESDRDHLLILSHTRLWNEPLVPRPWHYDTVIALPPDVVDQIGAAAAIDAIVAFADAVVVQAGTVFWTSSTIYASALATGGLTSGLSAAEQRAVRDSHDSSNHWGRIIRGPTWGTFLNAKQVVALDDVSALPASQIVRLASGGAFVQLTPIDEPTDVDSPSQRLDELRSALARVT